MGSLRSRLTALPCITSHAHVTRVTETGDYSSWMALENNRVQLFFDSTVSVVSIWEAPCSGASALRFSTGKTQPGGNLTGFQQG
jgi:hypothetical protein